MSRQPADPEIVARLIHDALWAEGGESVEGAFVDHWVSNASRACDELEELFQEHGFSEADAELFRQAMRREPAERMASLLDALRSWTGPVVLQMLDDPEPKARATALGVAWRFRPAESLIPYLKDPDPAVRAAALSTVCNRWHGVPQRELYQEEALTDPSPEVRRVAGLGFSFFGKPEAARKLAQLIENESDKSVRDELVTMVAAETARGGISVEAGRLLEKLGPELKAVLIRELNNDDPQVRKAVAEALARLRGPDVGNALLDRLEVEESGDVWFAVRHYHGFDEVLDRALEVFARRLEAEPDWWVRERLDHLRQQFFRRIAAALAPTPSIEEGSYFPHPSPEVAAAIQRRIDALPDERGKDWPVSEFKRDWNALPLHSTAALYVWGIQPDGTIICRDLDAVAHATEVEARPLVRFAVIVQGAARYPELQELIPAPPSGTRLCDKCRGSGGDTKNAGRSCSACDGYGWRSSP